MVHSIRFNSKRVISSSFLWHIVVGGALSLAAQIPAFSQCTAMQEGYLIAGDAAANDGLGLSVSLSGDTAIVGALWDDHSNFTDAGSAYIFRRTNGQWEQQQKLVALAPQSFVLFGESVSLDGSTAAIGAYNDVQASTRVGSVFIFRNTGTQWQQIQRLRALDLGDGDQFGWNVSLQGETLAIGAPGEDPSGMMNAGSVYIFVKISEAWFQQRKFFASDAGVGDRFGFSVALDGNTVLVGAPQDNLSAGSAYIFRLVGTVWTQIAKLVPDDAEANAKFGQSVALEGEMAVVGAWSDDGFRGAAYIFREQNGVWQEWKKLTGSDTQPNQQALFGGSVSIEEGTVVVGARSAPGGGGAYVFREVDGIWQEIDKITGAGQEAGDGFGESVCLNAGSLVVGAPFDDTPAGIDAGSAYVFSNIGMVDCDGDGLPDSWEKDGIPYLNSAGATRYYILPDADPNRKNVYVEADILTTVPASVADIRLNILQPVITAFDVAPVSNVNGALPGIILTVETSSELLLPPDDCINEVIEVPEMRAGINYPFKTIGCLADHMGDEITVKNRLEAKAKAYRYCLFTDCHVIDG